MTSAPITNALTFDVEDYFQVSAFEKRVRYEDWGKFESRVAGNTRRILDLLDSGGTKATFFVLGWVAEREPALVREIAERGHEVASHGFSHRLVYRMTPEEFREDVRRSKELLESITSRAVRGFRAPSFSIVTETLWGLEVLAELGFQYDSSIFPVVHPCYGMPRHERFPHRVSSAGNGSPGLVEFPLSTARIGGWNVPVAGGAYLRLFSHRFIRWGLRRLNAAGRPGILYLHPWELDPDQPRIPCSLATRLRHYLGLRRTEAALRKLLGEFRFATVVDVLGSLGLGWKVGAAS